MNHKSIAELESILREAATRVVVGGTYAHYKHPHQLYMVNGLSILEASDEVAVRYAMLAAPDVEFVRPLTSWLETVEWNGKTVPRFVYRG